VEIGRKNFKDSPGKKLVRPYLKNTSWVWWYFNLSYLGGGVRMISVSEEPGQKHETLSEK
jgi:hypothetical protein